MSIIQGLISNGNAANSGMRIVNTSGILRVALNDNTPILPPEIVVTGATSTIIGTNERCISFPYSGSGTTKDYTFTTTSNLLCDILIVGGGGAGGNSMGGGGGAGGVVYSVNQTLPTGTYTVKVGRGGIGLTLTDATGQGTIGTNQDGVESSLMNSNGSSYISQTLGGVSQQLRGYGGGGGGIYYSLSFVNGRNGGSGGGCTEANPGFGLNTPGSATQPATYWNGSSYVVGGKAGRQNTTTAQDYQAGGGGGLGAVSTDYRNGNDGIAINITGTSQFYAAGGGAGQYIGTSTSAGLGGSSIGGNGRIWTGSAYAAAPRDVATSGANGTGSGGGGAAYTQAPVSPAGNGGSGIVIIRYRNTSQSREGNTLFNIVGGGIATGATVYSNIITNHIDIPAWSFGSGTKIYYNTSNVGIGTPDPSVPLHIYNNILPTEIVAPSAMPTEIVVDGTTSTTIGTTERCIMFPYSGTGATKDYTFTTTENLICDILVVGGGGAGAGTIGGGGGAGALIFARNATLNGTYTINVGNGGTGGSQAQGTKGNSSIILQGSINITAEGGGASGRADGNQTGGSGGGGDYWQGNQIRGNSTSYTSTAFGASIIKYGNEGANAYTTSPFNGGGGGGAGSSALIATSTNLFSNGGTGLYQVIIDGITINFATHFGTNTSQVGGVLSNGNLYYGGGGGGGGNLNSLGGSGGIGGGGNGGNGVAVGGANIPIHGSNGLPNTGGGGGGGSNHPSLGGNGGSGIVIIRYRKPPSEIVVSSIISGTSDRYISFPYSGTGATKDYTITTTEALSCDILVVGGGGCGGRSGGGGGAVIYTRNVYFPIGGYTFKVGNGGISLKTGSVGDTQGANGSDSDILFGTITIFRAKGGGFGAANYIQSMTGGTGGSGGGSENRDNIPTFVPSVVSSANIISTNTSSSTFTTLTNQSPNGITIYGNRGGIGGSATVGGNTGYSGGGGGGAGGVGGNFNSSSLISGAGGLGISIEITGSAIKYGSGGASGIYNGSVNATQGTSGTVDSGGGTGAYTINTTSVFGSIPTAGRGGGGGGWGVNGNYGGAAEQLYAKDGGSGIIIIRYRLPLVSNARLLLDTTINSVASLEFRRGTGADMQNDYRFINDTDTSIKLQMENSTQLFGNTSANLASFSSNDTIIHKNTAINGRIGIGTVYHTTRSLDVVGDANVSGTVSVGGLSVLSSGGVNAIITNSLTSNTSLTIQNSYVAPTITSLPVATTTGTTGAYTYQVFTYTTETGGAGTGQSLYTLTVTGNVVCDVLIVAGGGGGGMNAGAGGGAGGLILLENTTLSTRTYTIRVGDGGNGGTVTTVNTVASNGKNSLFETNTAIAGGGGVNSGGANGNAGGSGGGAGNATTGNRTGGAGTAGQGFKGGDGTVAGGAERTGGGGGGAGGEGQASVSTTRAGDGGIGRNLSSFFGTSVGQSGWFAGGGGGGVHNGTGGTGGTGGGGSENVVGTNGTGGGGGAARSDSGAGRKGGSGIVIIRYLTPPTTISSSIEFIRGTAADPIRDYKLGNYNEEFKVISSTSGVDTDYIKITTAGAITNPTGTASWNTGSDRRIKENIERASYDKCYDNINKLELNRFNYIDGFNTVSRDSKQLGFIAQEVYDIFPKAISSQGYYTDTLSIPDLLSIDVSQINYSLYGAVKKLIEINEEHEKHLSSFDNRIKTIKTILNIAMELTNSNLVLDKMSSNFLDTTNNVIDT